LNNLTVTEFKGIRVLTTQQLAEKYETTDKKIRDNFSNNQDRYIEGKHYIKLEGEGLKQFKDDTEIFGAVGNRTSSVYLWTEKGAFLHAKSLNTDKAWESYSDLVDTYFKAKDFFEGASDELKAILMHDKKLQAVVEHIQDTDIRVENLENNMVIDYGQQRVLTERVNQIVIHWLGGKDSNAYSEIGRKVFKECSRDYNDYFNVNARNNTPKLKFDDAIYYLAHWEPCMNTKLEIQNCNSQIKLGA
jgi:hypothetical protein